MIKCAIDGCQKPKHKRIWCSPHYQRWLIHGDPLAGGTMAGAPIKFLREVASQFDGDECLLWPFAMRTDGYGSISVERRTTAPHRVVCEMVRGNPPTQEHETAHSCGNRGCVNPKHLRWASAQENCADKVLHGTMAWGERVGGAVLTESDAREIFSLKRKISQRQIAERFGVSQTTVRLIHNGRTWVRATRAAA